LGEVTVKVKDVLEECKDADPAFIQKTYVEGGGSGRRKR
jgi:hypothetical protein